MVVAFVFIDVQHDSASRVTEKLLSIPQVREVYLASDTHDVVAILGAHQENEVARIVAERIALLSGVHRVESLILERVYSADDLMHAWDIGVD